VKLSGDGIGEEDATFTTTYSTYQSFVDRNLVFFVFTLMWRLRDLWMGEVKVRRRVEVRK
jgi:hypothetical protein